MEARRAVAKFVRERAWLWNSLHPAYDWARWRVKHVRIQWNFADRLAPNDVAGQNLIGEAIAGGGPLAVGKIGGLEGEVASHYLRHRGQRRPYPKLLREQIFFNVGIFPDTDESLDAFSKALIEAAATIDILALMGYAGEVPVLRNHAMQAKLISLRSLDPWLFPQPWSARLAGKRVTVITPFAQTVAAQYQRRSEIWPNAGVLPEFQLRTIRAPLSPGLVKPEEPDWQTRLRNLQQALDDEPYDIVLVGAGGLSLLLAAHAKHKGRIGFHTGGPTQVLFGVRGRRWDADPAFARYMTTAWVRPREEETPRDAWLIERGAYW